MRVLNLSDSPPPSSMVDLEPERLILLPSRCDGEGWLPEGSVATFKADRHTPTSLLLGPETGCGILIARSEEPVENLKSFTYSLFQHVRASPPRLQGWDSFIGIYAVDTSCYPGLRPGDSLAIIHAGSSAASWQSFKEALYGDAFLEAVNTCAAEGARTRWELLETVRDLSHRDFHVLRDLPHNTLSYDSDSYVYRRGASTLKSGDIGVVVGRLGDPSRLVRASPRIEELCNSMVYSPGRKTPRHQMATQHLPDLDLEGKVMIPHFIYQEEIIMDHPANFRAWQDVACALAPYVSTVAVLEPKAYVN